MTTALTTTLNDSTGTGTGSVDWNFNIADHDLDFLAAGETLTVNYNVKVSDASTNANQTVSVVITGANDAVTMTGGPESAAVAEQSGMNGSSSLDSTTPVPTGTLNFTDVDLSDTHTVTTAVSSAIWSGGDFVPSQTIVDLQAALQTSLHDSTGLGTGGVDWSFSIADKDLDFLAAGETLTVTYDVTVADGSTSSTQTVTITATGANDPLVINPATADAFDSQFPDAGNVVTAGALDLNTGGDASAVATVTEVNGSAANVGTDVAGTYGTLILNADGSYAYTANSALDALQVGDNPTDQFTFTATDNQSRSVTTTLTFDVTGTDDAPRITTADTSASLTEDAGPTIIANGGFESGDLTAWTTIAPVGVDSHISVQFFGFGGEFENYSALLSPTTMGNESLVAGDRDHPGTTLYAGLLSQLAIPTRAATFSRPAGTVPKSWQ